ncbi:MAG TPA: serine/threonine-protein kinase [Polyangiaceae bacterium]|nr:serine/threonine-protein kinase [Polyangiaceae bacterium]
MTDPIEHLVRVGTPAGPSLEEALRSFAQLRSTPHEGRAVHRLLAREAIVPLPEPLLVAVASALVDRGEPGAATAALARCRSAPALLLRADLLERAFDLPAAIDLVERVLAHDIDSPGARERHVRLREALGRVLPSDPRGATAGVVAVAPDVPFRLVREAGRGGSAAVYEAEDPELLRRVALKVYHRPDRDRAKLLHEARVAVAVAGQGIVPVLDVDPGRGWLAMEWAPLGALGAQGRSTGIAWVAPLARALARVHAAGWVHHDVKPANVLLRAPESPMLADFGTARRQGDASPPGSPGYVSPERLAGRASDPRDDVYGFGRVLAEVLDASGPDSRGPPGAAAAAAPNADPADEAAWRALAADCLAPGDARPRDGTELALRIEALRSAARRR